MQEGTAMMRYIQYLHKIQPLYSTKLVSQKFNFLKASLSSRHDGWGRWADDLGNWVNSVKVGVMILFWLSK